MSDKPADTTIAHQVELAVGRLDCLSVLPSVAARFLSQLLEFELSPLALAQTIESDPALTCRILSLMSQEGLSFAGGGFEASLVSQALDKLSLRSVRDAFFSVKVHQAFEQDRALLRKQLVLHALGVGCCAGDIAGFVSPRISPQLAYSAGLLHNIGNLALEEAMPRSFASIVEEAKSKNACIRSIERKHLGIDYTILGKRLAQRWHFPSEITLAVWLHRSDTERISENMPEARIAQVIQLADLIVRQCGIGQSGSFDSPDSPEQIARSLAIVPEQVEQIRENLRETVRERAEVLRLDSPNAIGDYCDVVHSTAGRLAEENTGLCLKNRELQSASSDFVFIADFLSNINSNSSPVDIARNFATRWQKYYQAGLVCLYLVAPNDPRNLEAVVVESPDTSRVISLNAAGDSSPIPEAVAGEFAILNARDCKGVDWLFEQLDVDFELSHTKLVPVLSGGKAVGAIVFEFRYPAEMESVRERFKTATSILGGILDMAFVSGGQQRYAEQFAQLLGRVKTDEAATPSVNLPDALVEMAAGAAHELNNPLSVISGRAQLLAESETDEQRREILKQIQKNTSELSDIIDELMDFAEPPQPRPAQTNIGTLLDEAGQLAAQKTGVGQPDVQVDISEDVGDVFVDSAQIVSAIANIFSNSLESYSGGSGPIKVICDVDESEESVRLQISDQGCGMDQQTLRKSAQPFFSARPAGRKRGMGLAYAARLIQLNRGSVNITSQPGSGTTVTILLPRK